MLFPSERYSRLLFTLPLTAFLSCDNISPENLLHCTMTKFSLDFGRIIDSNDLHKETRAVPDHNVELHLHLNVFLVFAMVVNWNRKIILCRKEARKLISTL